MAENRKKHGIFTAMSRIKLGGLAAIDKRTLAARSLLGWKRELENALGGLESISPQEQCLIDAVVRTRAIIDHIDGYLLSQKSLINRKRKAVIPLVQQRSSVVNVMSNLLAQLGLERRPTKVPGLMEYLAEREEGKHADDDDFGDDGEREIIPADVQAARAAEED